MASHAAKRADEHIKNFPELTQELAQNVKARRAYRVEMGATDLIPVRTSEAPEADEHVCTAECDDE